MLNQRAIGNHKFSTLAAIKAVSNGNIQTVAYCDATETLYRWEPSGAAFTPNDQDILTTGSGGTTRWLGIAGQYKIVGAVPPKIYPSNNASGSSTSSTSFTPVAPTVQIILPTGFHYKIDWYIEQVTNLSFFPIPMNRLQDLTNVNTIAETYIESVLAPDYESSGGTYYVDLTGAPGNTTFRMEHKKLSGSGSGSITSRNVFLNALVVLP